jgi:hypothetical protein
MVLRHCSRYGHSRSELPTVATAALLLQVQPLSPPPVTSRDKRSNALPFIIAAGVVACVGPCHRTALGAQARATMVVTAIVAEASAFRAAYQAQAFIVTSADIRRGCADVWPGSQLEVTSAQCVLDFKATSSVFRGVEVSGTAGASEFGTEGGTLLLAGGSRRGRVVLYHRFRLADHVVPGTYSWPLILTVLPG